MSPPPSPNKLNSNRLLHCIRKKRWNEVSCYIDEVPYSRDESHRTALHWACLRNAPLSIIKSIFNQYPEAAFERDECGCTPLLCQGGNFSEGVLQFFLLNAPNCFTVEDSLGWKPLHYEITSTRPIETIERIIQVDRSSIEFKNNDGDTPVDLFFRSWYIPIKKLVNTLRETQSPTEIRSLGLDYEGKIFTVDYLYRIVSTLLQPHKPHSKQNILHLSINNHSCPWIWCELLLHIHPEQVAMTNSSRLSTLAMVTGTSKEMCYKKLFQCVECKSKITDTVWFDGQNYHCDLCAKKWGCADDDFVKDWVKLDYREEMQNVLTITYKILREHPVLVDAKGLLGMSWSRVGERKRKRNCVQI